MVLQTRFEGSESRQSAHSIVHSVCEHQNSHCAWYENSVLNCTCSEFAGDIVAKNTQEQVRTPWPLKDHLCQFICPIIATLIQASYSRLISISALYELPINVPIFLHRPCGSCSVWFFYFWRTIPRRSSASSLSSPLCPSSAPSFRSSTRSWPRRRAQGHWGAEGGAEAADRHCHAAWNDCGLSTIFAAVVES